MNWRIYQVTASATQQQSGVLSIAAISLIIMARSEAEARGSLTPSGPIAGMSLDNASVQDVTDHCRELLRRVDAGEEPDPSWTVLKVMA
jgi:hypothetical protein